MSEQWYRNRDWSPEIEAEFEKRIARGRSQKAQHLMIQGMALIPRHPDVAARLLERSIALEDDFHLNQANCQLALARLAQGDVEGALRAYEAALEAQLKRPNIQTGAPLDYAFTVAWFERSERYELALTILEALKPSIFPGANFQADAAHSLILSDLGRAAEAKCKAQAVLQDVPDDEQAVWAGISMAELGRRLRTIAELPAKSVAEGGVVANNS